MVIGSDVASLLWNAAVVSEVVDTVEPLGQVPAEPVSFNFVFLLIISSGK